MSPSVRYPVIESNVLLAIEENLPIELAAVEEKIKWMNLELADLYAYRTKLVRISDCHAIRSDDSGAEDLVDSSHLQVRAPRTKETILGGGE